MKGLIVYSSQTGNTEKLARALENGLDQEADWTLARMGDQVNIDDYDVVLAGAWVDRGYPNMKAKKWIEELPETRLGLFVTMAAYPDSSHGEIVLDHLNEMLEGHESLGAVALPGLVNEAVLDRVRNSPPEAWSDSVLRWMIDTGAASRAATNDEYYEAIAFFKEKLKAVKA